jgi:hypothetical protein
MMKEAPMARNHDRRDLILFGSKALGLKGFVLRRVVRAHERALKASDEIRNNIYIEEGRAQP